MSEQANTRKLLILLSGCTKNKDTLNAIVVGLIRSSDTYRLIKDIDSYCFITKKAKNIESSLRDFSNHDLSKKTIRELYEYFSCLKLMDKSFRELHEDSVRLADSLDNEIDILTHSKYSQTLHRVLDAIRLCIADNVIYCDHRKIILPPTDDLIALLVFYRTIKNNARLNTSWHYNIEDYLFLSDQAKNVESNLKYLLSADLRSKTIVEQFNHLSIMWREMANFESLLAKSHGNAAMMEQGIDIIETVKHKRIVEDVREKIRSILADMIHWTRLNDIKKIGIPNFDDLNELIRYTERLKEMSQSVLLSKTEQTIKKTITNIPEDNIFSIFDSNTVTKLADKKPDISIPFGSFQEVNILRITGGKAFCIDREDYDDFKHKYWQLKKRRRIVTAVVIFSCFASLIGISVVMGMSKQRDTLAIIRNVKNDIQEKNWDAALSKIQRIDKSENAIKKSSVCGNTITAFLNIDSCVKTAIEINMIKRESYYRRAFQAYTTKRWDDAITYYNVIKEIDNHAATEFSYQTYNSFLNEYSEKRNIKNITPFLNNSFYHSGVEDLQKHNNYTRARRKFDNLPNDDKYKEGRLLLRQEEARLNREEINNPATGFIPSVHGRIMEVSLVSKIDKDIFYTVLKGYAAILQNEQIGNVINSHQNIGCQLYIEYEKQISKGTKVNIKAVIIDPDDIKVGETQSFFIFNSNDIELVDRSYCIIHLSPLENAKKQGTYHLIIYSDTTKVAQTSFILNP